MTLAKAWNVGDVLTAADLDSWSVPNTAVKAVDTSRTSNTTLANDPELTLSVAANVVYRFWCYLNYEGGTQGASDIKWSFTVPAGATLRYQMIAVNTAGSLSPLLIGPTFTATSTNSAATNGAGNLMAAVMHGTLDTAGTAGTFVIQWAQNTSSGTSTILHAQSAMTLDRIA